MLHVFFISFIIIILTIFIGLYAIKFLSSYFIMKLIIALKGFILGHKSAPWIKLVFSFQVPENQVILASLSISWIIYFDRPRKTLLWPAGVKAVDLQNPLILIQDIKKIWLKESIYSYGDKILFFSFFPSIIIAFLIRLANVELIEKNILLSYYYIFFVINAIAFLYKFITFYKQI